MTENLKEEINELKLKLKEANSEKSKLDKNLSELKSKSIKLSKIKNFNYSKINISFKNKIIKKIIN